MLYDDLSVVDLDKREITQVTGTIESYQKHNRWYEIHIVEDDLNYRINNIYQGEFYQELFEQDVNVGDTIELSCTDYWGSSTFQSEPVTQASVYAVSVDNTDYLTFQDSVDIYYDKGVNAGPYIIFIFSAYGIGGSIYFFIKMRKDQRKEIRL